MKTLLIAIVTFFSVSSFAGNTWYYGEVTRIQTYESDGSFQIYVDNQDLITNCLYQRVNFRVANMGAERTKAALSMAMTAFVSGKEWGVVVDIVNPNEVCEASSTASQGAGIQ